MRKIRAPKKTKLDLRFKSSDEPHDPNAKRFDFFLIDTGWNSAVSEAVHSHLKPLMSLEKKRRCTSSRKNNRSSSSKTRLT